MSRKRKSKRRIKVKCEPSGVIIYDPDVDPNGENATREYYKKYPECANDNDGVLIMLPKIEKLPD